MLPYRTANDVSAEDVTHLCNSFLVSFRTLCFPNLLVTQCPGRSFIVLLELLFTLFAHAKLHYIPDGIINSCDAVFDAQNDAVTSDADHDQSQSTTTSGVNI